MRAGDLAFHRGHSGTGGTAGRVPLADRRLLAIAERRSSEGRQVALFTHPNPDGTDD